MIKKFIFLLSFFFIITTSLLFINNLSLTVSAQSPTISIGNGDANGDGVVNSKDILTVVSNYNKSLGLPTDQYGDGLVNMVDLGVVINSILNPSPTPTPTSTPFPTPTGPNPTPAPVGSDWPMSGANPQRTSHNSVEVRGPYNPVWYRPIDPYIDNKVQVIATGGKVYVSSSKGLYAFDAGNGNQLWVYGTEMPLGNSPTVVTVNGKSVAYVGGFDHRIHAVDTSSGTDLTGYTAYEAQAGFDINPLFINDSYVTNTVFAGNRDGNFYALDAVTGLKKWSYTTGGAINYSAAYKNGTVYFASDDSYAYALNASTGALIWKSAKLPGVGFDMYWPVIYTDPASNKDYVIFIGSTKGAAMCDTNATPFGCSNHTPNFEMYNGLSGYCGATGTSTSNNVTNLNDNNYLWPIGTQTIKCDIPWNYYNNNPTRWGGLPPYWRFTFILDSSTGTETTWYPPFTSSPMDGDGQGYKYPPVVGADSVLYTFNGYIAGGNGGAVQDVTGWKFGTPYISRVVDEMASGTDGASDEPRTMTSGGNLIYYGEGSFNHEGFGAIEISKPLGSNAYWRFNPVYSGSDIKYTSLRLEGKFGGNNGAYGYMDGVLNFSPIPYNGKLYLINGNTLIALSSTGTTSSPLPTAQIPSNQNSYSVSTTVSSLQQTLNNEVQKMVNAGHLRPGFMDSGFVSQFMAGAYDNPGPNEHLLEYFHNPAWTVAILVNALPYLSSSLQTQVKTYLQTYYGITGSTPSPYSFINYASVGWKNGAKREAYDDTQEMINQFNDGYDPNSYVANGPRTCIWTYNNLRIATSTNDGCPYNGGFPPDSFYGAWKYAQTFPGTAATIFNLMKNKLSTADQAGANNDMTDANLIKYPWILNEYIVGYRGYMELEKLAGVTTDISQSSKYAEYTRLVNLRLNNYSKDVPWDGSYNVNNDLNASRNFIYLVPELADILRTNKISQVQDTISQYDILTPYSFVSKYDRSYGESYYQPLYDYAYVFQARAQILKTPFSQLIKYLDVPAFQTGDLFYIQNLVAALQAPQ